MSSQIYYENIVARIPADVLSASEDHFIQLTLDGASNSYVGDARVRRWHLQSFGTSEELIAGAIAHSHHFDVGNSCWKTNGSSGHLNATQWIRKIRNAISQAQVWLPDVNNIMASNSNYIHLRGKGELLGKNNTGILRALYEKSLSLNQDRNDWPNYWDRVSVDGPGSV